MQKKVLVVSIDHIYGLGYLSVTLIERLKVELEKSKIVVLEHSVPDIPRALLQGAVFLADNKMVGERFWCDFQNELFIKAKVCDTIHQQVDEATKKGATTVILCKNFNGTVIHGMMRNRKWYEEGMDAMDLRARCGTSLWDNSEPIEPDVNILLDIDAEVAYRTYKESLDDLLEKISNSDTSDTRRKIQTLFSRMDFFKQRPAYLDEFERLGRKGEIVDANDSDDAIFTSVLRIINRKLEEN